MGELIELAQRLDFAAECSDMGREPDHSSVTRRAAKALREAADRIAELESWKAAEEAHHHLLNRRIQALEAQLAARDGEIAAWLREGAKNELTRKSPEGWDAVEWCGRQLAMSGALNAAAEGVARGYYRKDQGNE